MQNNPIRFTDPTGHKLEEDIEGGGPCNIINCSTMEEEDHPGGGGNCDTNRNGVADVPCRGLRTRDWEDGSKRLGSSDICPVTSLIECYYLHASLNMGQDPINIDLKDFEALLLAIFYEVHGRNSLDLILTSMSFDTPFYDQGRLGIGAIPGSACIDGLGCYERHELNYIAQGEIAAAAGESRLGGLDRVYIWKLVFGPLHTPSPGTIEMWNIGYDFYHTKNGSNPPIDTREYYWITME